MSLIIETGSCVHGAEAWASVEYVDGYWSKRPQRIYADQWDALTTEQKEGCIREATARIDALDQDFIGIRRGSVQGLCWPRVEAFDAAGYEWPDIPDQLLRATAELAVRASSAELRPDLAQTGGIVSASAGSVSVTFASGSDGAGASPHKLHTAAMDILGPLIMQRGWSWA